jgi:hypothetical protein
MTRPDPAAAGIPPADLCVLGDLSVLGEVLTDLDEFLRCGDGVAQRLVAFYAHRGHPHPRFAATNLIDAVGFTALRLRHHDDTGHDNTGHDNTGHDNTGHDNTGHDNNGHDEAGGR